MYRIIGADGREYGPAGADQIRQWIAEGRADARTGIKAGSGGWVPLGSLADFSDIFPPPVVPPPVQMKTQPRAVSDIRPDYDLRIGTCIGRGWRLVMNNFWLLVGASFVAMAIMTTNFIPYIGPLISLIVSGPVIGGVFLLYLKKVRGEPAMIGDMFSGFGPDFGMLLAGYLVSVLLILAGLIFLIIPGIYFMVSYTFALPLIIDKKMDFWQAMELSRKMVGRHWWKVFGLIIVLLLLGLAGLMVFLVGFFVAGAIAQAAIAYAYEDTFNPRYAPAVVIP